MSDSEPVSLEFIEDPYLPKIDDDLTTPAIDWSDDTDDDLYLHKLHLNAMHLDDSSNTTNRKHNRRNYTIDLDRTTDAVHDLEMQAVETEFITVTTTATTSDRNESNSSSRRTYRKLLPKQRMRDVKVTFVDFSKPYLAKISSNDNYKKFLNIGSISTTNTTTATTTATNPAITSKDSAYSDKGATSPTASVASAEIAAEFAALSAEEQEFRRAEWTKELAAVEEEIKSLRTVLASKTREASELKRKLGITLWKDITGDVNQSLKSVKESNLYQRTESVLKSTTEMTASVFGSITSGISSKLSQMKNSESMKSIEEKVGSAYENVKTKMSTSSRSGSVSSFNDALSDNSLFGVDSPTNNPKKI